MALSNLQGFKKLSTLIEGNPKAPFSIATTLRCRGRLYSIPWIAPLYPWSYLIMLNVKQGGIKYHFFESLVCLDLVLANTLLIRLKTNHPSLDLLHFKYHMLALFANFTSYQMRWWGGWSCGIVANVLDFNFVVSKFKFQLCYYVHFCSQIPLRKVWTPLSAPPQAIG